LFSGLIFAYGATQVTQIWALWQLDYALLAMSTAAIAAIALAAAIAIWPATASRRCHAEDQLAAAQQSLAEALARINAGFAAADLSGKVIVHAEAESRRLAAIVESCNDAIIGKTLDGRITSWNGAAQSIFGYSAEEAIGQPVQMLIPPERQAEEMRILGQLSQGEAVPTFDTVRLTRSGERLDVQITVSPFKDDEGRVVGASKIARDVSRQRQAEAALSDSEERLRFTLDAAHIGDWNLDLATGVMQHSARHDQCFGYAELQVDWNFDKFIQHVHPEDRAEVEQMLHVAITESRDWRVQCRVVWPDGSVHWISKHGSVQRQGDDATRMLGIVSEITEQRQAENARLLAQRLEAENRQIPIRATTSSSKWRPSPKIWQRPAIWRQRRLHRDR
jgi:PAS domain S-box-containing protein